MNGSVALITCLISASAIVSLLLFSKGGGRQPGEKHIPELLPVECDQKYDVRMLKSRHMEVCNKLEEWFNEYRDQQAGQKWREAIKLYEEMRDSDSAVVELNIALMTHTRIKWDKDAMNSETLRSWIKYAKNAVIRAEQLRAKEPERYTQEVKDCLDSLNFELSKYD